MVKKKIPKDPSIITNPYVIYSLKRSIVRKKIIKYLMDESPNPCSISNIAHNVSSSPYNVTGAIKGVKSRYADTKSLINLNIVEQISIDKKNYKKLYKLTDFGKEIVEIL